METEQNKVMQTQNAEGVLRSWHYDGYSTHQVGAGLGGESFLLQTSDGATALFDTGFAYCAPQTLENIFAITEGKPVDLIVFTHSHYDHCAGANYLLAHMPGTKVAASAYAAYVFTREGAYKTMNAMNASRAESLGLGEYETINKEIPVDIVLEDGDTLTVGKLEFTALSAVGHTKCCMAFWCEAAGLFVSSETSGVLCASIPKSVDVPSDVKYMVDLIELVSFQSAMDHIERARALPIQVFVATHYGVIDGEDVAAMWHSVDFWRDYIVNMVMGMHDEGRSVEEITAVYKDIFYWGGTAPYQPEPAFDLNISYAIPSVIRDCGGE